MVTANCRLMALMFFRSATIKPMRYSAKWTAGGFVVKDIAEQFQCLIHSRRTKGGIVERLLRES